MKTKTKCLIVITATFLMIFASCKKIDSWLDSKSNANQVVPKTLDQLQQVLDNYYNLNDALPTLGMCGADNFYVTNNMLATADQVERNAYTWQKDIFQGATSTDWDNTYKMIQYANTVLDGLGAIKQTSSNQLQYDNIKGSALFFRSLGFYSIAQLFCKPYSATASNDLGIPLRLTSDVSEGSSRSTVEQTYAQMVGDIRQAIDLLPITPLVTIRPGKAAAHGLLAKVFLSMERYGDALSASSAALSINSTLLDYNSALVQPNSTFRFPTYTTGNPEVVFYGEAIGEGFSFVAAAVNKASVDTVLFSMYDNNDLRKSLLYFSSNGRTVFTGSYTGSYQNFGGIANNEVLLIHAECAVRTGDRNTALTDLNALLSKRFRIGTFVPITGNTDSVVLSTVLNERRKELPFTGQLRWEDLRRLNKTSATAVIVTRILVGGTYKLMPGDALYVYPIADDELKLSGIPQNPR